MFYMRHSRTLMSYKSSFEKYILIIGIHDNITFDIFENCQNISFQPKALTDTEHILNSTHPI